MDCPSNLVIFRLCNFVEQKSREDHFLGKLTPFFGSSVSIVKQDTETLIDLIILEVLALLTKGDICALALSLGIELIFSRFLSSLAWE